MNYLNKISEMYKNTQKHGGFYKHYLTLYSIVEGLETKNSFEFGAGFSTEVILEASSKYKGHHICCDIREIENTGLTKEFVESNNRLTYLKKNSLEIDYTLLKQFDCILHDGSHIDTVVEKDLHNIFPHVKNGGIILIHDTNNKYNLLDVIKNFTFERGLSYVTLPYSYGLSIIQCRNIFNENKIKITWEKGM